MYINNEEEVTDINVILPKSPDKQFPPFSVSWKFVGEKYCTVFLQKGLEQGIQLALSMMESRGGASNIVLRQQIEQQMKQQQQQQQLKDKMQEPLLLKYAIDGTEVNRNSTLMQWIKEIVMFMGIKLLLLTSMFPDLQDRKKTLEFSGYFVQAV